MKIITMFVCIMMICLLRLDMVSAIVPQWKDAELKMVDSYIVGQPVSVRCHGIYEHRTVAGSFESHNICMSGYSNHGIQFGEYAVHGTIFHVVGFRYDSLVYPFGGCESYDNCIYLPDQNMLIRREHLINNIVRSLVIYKDFSKRLVRSNPMSIFDRTYSLNDDDPDFVLQSSEGYPWPILGMGASANGRWLGIQLSGRGYAYIDTSDFSVRRLTNDKVSSSTEIALSNAGDAMAIVGTDFGQRVIDINDECGDSPDEWLQPIEESQSCSSRYIYIDGYGAIGPTVDDPNFDSTGTVLSFSVVSEGGVLKKIYLSRDLDGISRIGYLALGDSFTSGEGELDDAYYLPYTNEEFHKCHTSSRSYPFVVNIASTVKSVACSGATIQDVIDMHYDYWGQNNRLGVTEQDLSNSQRLSQQAEGLSNFYPGLVQQEKFIERYKPEVVTIGIGGNDAGLMSKLQACLMPDLCEWAVDPVYRQRTAEEIGRLYDRLSSVYTRLKELSPNSRFYAVGYPDIIASNGSCSVLIQSMLGYEERVFIEESIGYLNEVIESAARRSGIGYIDIEGSLVGHRICEDGEPGVNTIRLGEEIAPVKSIDWLKVIGSESFHPTPLGHQMIGATVNHRLNETPISECESHTSCIQSAELPIPSPYWGDNFINDSLTSVIQFTTELIKENVIDPKDLNLAINLPEYTFMPGSRVAVSVHSKVEYLGDYEVGPNGEFISRIDLPKTIGPGFHTLHVEGTLMSGRAIDMYQTFLLPLLPLESFNTTNNPIDNTINPRNNDDNLISIGGNIAVTQNVLSAQDSGLISVPLIDDSSESTRGEGAASDSRSFVRAIATVMMVVFLAGIYWKWVRYMRSYQ